MSTKVLFIDVDGTLVGFKDGQAIIPESAKQAIKIARKNGHLAFLCTGRSEAEIYDDIREIGFNGMIGAAGGYITYNNNILFHKKLDKAVVEEIVEFANDNHISFYLESNSGLYANDLMMDYMHQNFDMENIQPGTFQSIVYPLERADFNEVNKVSFISETLSYEEIENKYGKNFYMVKASWPGSQGEAGEISSQGINKATAIHFLLDHLGMDEVETYGFGDSMNDIEMFQNVDIAVAMGDARHGIKDYAHFVTKDLLDDGLEFAFKHYGLI